MIKYYKQFDNFSKTNYYKIENGVVWLYWGRWKPGACSRQWVLSEDRWGYKKPEQILNAKDTCEISEGEMMLELL